MAAPAHLPRDVHRQRPFRGSCAGRGGRDRFAEPGGAELLVYTESDFRRFQKST